MSFLNEGDRNPWNPRTNITLGVILVMVIGGGTLIWQYHDAIFGSGSGNDTSRLERELRIGEQMVNRSAPQRVDAITTLVGARTQGTEFTYLYTVSQDVPTDQVAAAQANIQREIGPRLCGDPNMRRVMAMGATISAEFRDPSGDRIRATVRSCAGV
jgi:hypothetical protein